VTYILSDSCGAEEQEEAADAGGSVRSPRRRSLHDNTLCALLACIIL